jgi:hypothetical protein
VEQGFAVLNTLTTTAGDIVSHFMNSVEEGGVEFLVVRRAVLLKGVCAR